MRDFQRPGRSAVYAENGMAATSHPLATSTAVNILRHGGNAVDATIAASATLAVVEPHMTGVGGDCFAIVVEPNGAVHGLNGSVRAPAAADPEKLRACGRVTMPETGALSVTVPGAVKAWQVFLQRFGTRSFDEVFAEAIRYAELGFPVSSRVALDWLGCEKILRNDAGAAKHWLLGGEAPKVGQRFQAPALGATLRAIAHGGAEEFCNGEIDQEIAGTHAYHPWRQAVQNVDLKDQPSRYIGGRASIHRPTAFPDSATA